MLTEFEFWTLKAGANGLTRISVRVSGQGQRDSWLAATSERTIKFNRVRIYGRDWEPNRSPSWCGWLPSSGWRGAE